MRKIFDILAIICSIVFFVFAMAVETNLNAAAICLISGAYLFVYAIILDKEAECL